MLYFSPNLDQNIGERFYIYHFAIILGPKSILKFRLLFMSCCWNFCFLKLVVNFSLPFFLYFSQILIIIFVQEADLNKVINFKDFVLM
jgi:hypothetical protein